MLQDKKILLGISGSIAAYKTAHLVRLLVKEGAEVKVILTASAADFITPLTLSTLSKHPVLTSFVKNDQGQWNNHVELGLWADLMLIAPLSANTLAKMANGICDNLLIATYLSARCPIIAAPAMDLDMYTHNSTLRNLDQLQKDGVNIIEARHGELASGLQGQGRMAEPVEIVEEVKNFFSTNFRSILKNKNVMITSGPTYESIDPVRFVGNRSSGKMGYSIARILGDLGAKVTVISGPTNQKLIHSNVEIINVESAKEMFSECQKIHTSTDISIFAAAVSDYAPATVAPEKLKKIDGDLSLSLRRTPDIAAELGKKKRDDQIHVGFALETENEETHALEKLKKKNFDLIVLNSLRDAGAGFGHNTNKITIFDKHNNIEKFELKNKEEVARDIINALIKIFS